MISTDCFGIELVEILGCTVEFCDCECHYFQFSDITHVATDSCVIELATNIIDNKNKSSGLSTGPRLQVLNVHELFFLIKIRFKSYITI